MRAPASSPAEVAAAGSGSGSGSGSARAPAPARRGGREVLGLGLRLGVDRADLADLLLQRSEPVGEALAAGPEPVEQLAELALSSSRRRSMPSAASPTRSTWALASRPASSRSSVALRSAASRISAHLLRRPGRQRATASARPPGRARGPSRRRRGAGARRRPPGRSRGGRPGSRRAGCRLAPRALTVAGATGRRVADRQTVAHQARLGALAPRGLELRRRLAGDQRGDDPPARPAVRVLEALPRTRPRRGVAAAASPGDRAGPAVGPPGAADRRAELHHRLVERRRPARREQRAGALGQLARCAVDPVVAGEHAPDVGVDRRHLAVPGERADRGRRVRRRRLAARSGPPASRAPRRGARRAGAPERAGCSRGRSRRRARRRSARAASASASGKRRRNAS